MIFDDDLIPRRRPPPRTNRENVLGLLPQESKPVEQTERYYSMHSPKVEAKKQMAATMGKPHVTVDPHKFQRKQDRSLPPVREFHYQDMVPRKPDVPLRSEEPIHGLRSYTDFVRTNALAAVSSSAKKPSHNEIHYTSIPGYGERPAYLDRVQAEIAEEQRIIHDIKTEQAYEEFIAAKEPEEMSEEERQTLLKGLKKRWTEIKDQIGHMSLHIDIGSIRMRKEDLERELAEIENDMEKLSKKRVFVERE
ncbi:putative Calmodulin-binding [Monocercomonoides exilis]|uniref:putative Calmodulin-binding n=1 Tax=Monocercomonoides exilis TaxID=2049356 RepID=UPI00355A1B1B|nr:putative Calmodulin-binding [Monocercomonoides exilis]|eukprot:MONOS_792.1-p1 / transcript=MONOS_792.1 / gene=MONOS_792 / organism=Monocercomonoides_exilis_PA203 / gene_product=chromosome 10 open reading frame 63, isoform CRA_b / transcript_product=chromosome 10 open reading frame 63, isoform CRA_b / location=Mono_scaffold00013:137176-138217(-) / protein_length=249 / sequence_SO=supercontig / SO=protein_coding / is_pseudo=false